MDEALEEVDLAGKGKKTFKNFSLGMKKQRLGAGPGADEPAGPPALWTSPSADWTGGHRGVPKPLLTLNQERQTTILISSHILSELANRGHLLRLPGQRHDAGADFPPGPGGKVPRLY